MIENDVYVSLNGNCLYFVKRTVVVCRWNKITFLRVTKSAKRGKCVDINLEENRIYVLTSSLVVCTVTLQYIFFLILALAGDIEKNPGPMGIMHSFREIISRGAGHLSNRAGYVATQVACGWAGAIFEVTRPLGQEQ